MTSMKYMKRIGKVLFMAILMVACSPEDGEDGAIGPQGEQGPAGPTGLQGEQGEVGSANVIYSDWIPNDFVPGGGLLQKVFVLASADEINSLNVNLDTSTVMVYGRGNVLLVAGDEVFPLPYTTGAGDRYTFTINDGQIRAVGLTSNVANNDFDVFDDYRYIIIPGAESIGGKTSTLNYNKMTYQEITEHFNIPE